MTYVKNTWVDQAGQIRYTETEDDGYKIFTANYDEITELGTPVNATNMNHIEQGIYDNDSHIGNLSELETDVKTDLVSAINEARGGSGYEIGDIVARFAPTQDAGKHLLDGTLLLYASYSGVIDYYASLYNSGDYPNLFTTEATWQSTVTTYGSCGKFVYDNDNKTLRLPKISDILQGTTDMSALGSLVQAGLPNITGKFNKDWVVTADGCFYHTTGPSNGSNDGDDGDTNYIGFDASRSSSIYGNSNTVQPQTIKVLYYIVIATTSKTDVQVNIDEIATDLNGKVDVDLTNVNNSGTSLGASWGMPSSTHKNLTLGASGATYTAPANGWVNLTARQTANGGFICLRDNTTAIETRNQTAYNDNWLNVYIPVKKNDTFVAEYVGATVTIFYFIYAVGSESEAS